MASQGFAGGNDDQDRLLDEATAVVKEQAFYMKRAMDNENLREALKHASNLICELRTSLLSPKNYYELYMQVFQEMQHLSNFFNSPDRHKRKMTDLYESVQHAGNILPRMYLLATVGASYIKSKEAPAKEILKDMSELTKGVQHPVRGLFLRYYLSQMVKDKLPDTGSEYELEGGGDINDAFDFIHTNFVESNRLWVRIQHQGPMKDKQKREKERHDLRVLVGANLVRLSQLEGMDADFFKEKALPKLLEHVLSVKDTMSQQYLFESMIQVFPDEFHIQTLEQELAAYTKAQPSVDMKPIMVTLMNRLTVFLNEHKDEPHALQGVDIFSLFKVHMKAILERTLEPGTQGGPSTPDIGPALELQGAFMSFTLSLFSEDEDAYVKVDLILETTANVLEKYFERVAETGGNNQRKLSGSPAEKVVELLSHLIKSMPENVLDMQNCANLIEYLTLPIRKQVAFLMVQSVLDGKLPIDSTDRWQKIANFISPVVIRQEEDVIPAEGSEDKELKAEQQKVSMLVYKIEASLDDEMAILTEMRKSFGKGGPERIVYTLQTIVYAGYRLIEKKKRELQKIAEGEEVAASGVTFKKLMGFAHKTICAIQGGEGESINTRQPLVVINLWLAGMKVADNCDDPGLTEIIGEFCDRMNEILADHVTGSGDQEAAILSIVGVLTSINNIDEDRYVTLRTFIVKMCNQQLKKVTKVRLITEATQLFMHDISYDKKAAMECYQKVLKIVMPYVQENPAECHLWADVCDIYLYTLVKQNGEVTQASHVEQLRKLCVENTKFALAQTDDDKARDGGLKASAHLKATKALVNCWKRNTSDETIIHQVEPWEDEF